MFTAKFKDKTFQVTVCGTSSPQWLVDSFAWENELRVKWWDIRPGDVVIDVGAAYGSYTLTALAAGAKKVIAYEPSKAGFFSLCTNLLVNDFPGQCLPLSVLAGEGDKIYFKDDYYPETSSARPQGEPEPRLVIPVDVAVHKAGLGRVDWIKIDVEGDELKVLQGAAHTLNKHRPRLLVENHEGFVPGIRQQIQEFLAPLGYQEENITEGEDNQNWSLWTYGEPHGQG